MMTRKWAHGEVGVGEGGNSSPPRLLLVDGNVSCVQQVHLLKCGPGLGGLMEQVPLACPWQSLDDVPWSSGLW